jgi:TatD DNase family protein
MTAILVDSHCHLDFPDFDEEREDIINRARQAGVAYMLTISTHLSRFPGVLAIAEEHQGIWCSLGVHPHEADKEAASATPERLVELSSHPKVIGLGETGLDYYYEHSERSRQQESFRNHLTASQETGLPVIVHTRSADDDTIEILKEAAGNGPITGLIHCFSTSRELAEKAVELGFYISLSGIVTFKKSDELRAIVADLPLDRILVETDAPYLAPMPKRGKRNEPAFTAHTAALVAEIKGISIDELARATTENFFRLFSKAERIAGDVISNSGST